MGTMERPHRGHATLWDEEDDTKEFVRTQILKGG